MSQRLDFTCEGRQRKLIRLKATGPYHIRFQFQGKDVLRSLGTTQITDAVRKAKEIISAAYAGDQDTLRRNKVRSDYPLLRPVCDRYIEKFSRDARSRRSARGNVGALAVIIAKATGGTLENTRANALTGELIRKYEAAYEATIPRDRADNMDPSAELRIRTTIGSYLRQARSIFKRSHMSWFEDFALPNLDTFRAQGVMAADRPKPRPLDPGVIEKINAAAPRLAIDQPAVYAAHLLFKFLGMRNGEIKAARRTWVVKDASGAGKLGIIYRPEVAYKPKKKTERWIPIAASVLAEVERFAEPESEGFLVPAPNKTDRATIVDDKHSAWVGQWIQNRSKTSYELRRYAGSQVYRKTGKLEYVQQFLGHAHIQTTMEWYWYLIGEVPALEPEDFAPAVPTALAVVA